MPWPLLVQWRSMSLTMRCGGGTLPPSLPPSLPHSLPPSLLPYSQHSDCFLSLDCSLALDQVERAEVELCQSCGREGGREGGKEGGFDLGVSFFPSLVSSFDFTLTFSLPPSLPACYL